MSRTVEDIENAIIQLPQNQLQQFRDWYEKFDMDSWDEQIKKDVDSGNLDSLASEAIRDHNTGRSRKI